MLSSRNSLIPWALVLKRVTSTINASSYLDVNLARKLLMLKLQNMDKAASLNMAGRMPDGTGQPYNL